MFWATRAFFPNAYRELRYSYALGNHYAVFRFLGGGREDEFWAVSFVGAFANLVRFAYRLLDRAERRTRR